MSSRASKSFLIFGHRGSPKRFPENTVPAFEEALRCGADGFETDLRLLSDSTAVLYHDDEFEEDELETLSAVALAERGAMVQRLDDLAAFADRTMMILEVKRRKWETTLLEHVGTWPNVVIASFDHLAIAELASRNTGIALGITCYGYLLNIADYAAALGVTWCFPAFHFVDEEMVDALHARNIKVVPWTANRERDWRRLYEIGCDGVITDYPAEAVTWREGVGG